MRKSRIAWRKNCSAIDQAWLTEKREIFGPSAPVSNDSRTAHNIPVLLVLIAIGSGFIGLVLFALLDLFRVYDFAEVLLGCLVVIVLVCGGLLFGQLCVFLPTRLVRMEVRYRRAWRTYRERRPGFSPVPSDPRQPNRHFSRLAD